MSQRRIAMFLSDERGVSRLAAVLVIAAALAVGLFGGLAVTEARSGWDVVRSPFGQANVRSDDSSGANDEADENEARDSRGQSEPDENDSEGSRGEP